MNDPLPRLGRYGLSAPTADDFLRAIANVSSVDVDEIWDSICRDTGVPPGIVVLTIVQAQDLATTMTSREGRLGVAGRAMAARVKTYAGLASQPGSELGFPEDWGSTTLGMLIRARPVDDDRATTIASLDLFSPAVRERLDRVAERISRLVGTQVGLVTLVTEDSQLFLGGHGLPDWAREVNGTPVEWSFCANIVREGAPVIINDTEADVIQRGNPMVTHEGIRSYAGAPITVDGHVIGACCVLDITPRTFTAEHAAALEAAANGVADGLDRIPSQAA